MPIIKRLKDVFIGKARDLGDRQIFHQMSLVAFFAWVGLGADGLSSSCYGPEEAFMALGQHHYLGIFVALLTALTVFVISASYIQIIDLFPNGGGGYFVASKLLSPRLGMVTGCTLIIDYVLTIAISIASGSDALFSFLPVGLHEWKLWFAIGGIVLLIIMNLRGVKESIMTLTPIFILFLVTHVFIILYALGVHILDVPTVLKAGVADAGAARAELGMFGMLFLIFKAYSMGAGTFTGIEAVSNGLPLLREPRAATGKITMGYMAISLAVTVMGLMMAYLLFNVTREPGKTLNASLFTAVTATWPAPWGTVFILVTLVSEALLLFVAAQAGFLGGPRVLANMATDRWMPSRFTNLSDRLVTQNGVLLMGVAALLTVIFTHGSVALLVVLYSISVFVTFCLSQAGMVRHWWERRLANESWKRRISVPLAGFLLTLFVLVSLVVIKFYEGGWVTLVIIGVLVAAALFIKNHYADTFKLLKRLDVLVETAVADAERHGDRPIAFDDKGKVAVVMVNGFNGLGLHTVMGVVKNFGREFRNFVFVQVGILDAGNFKGIEEVGSLKEAVNKDLARYCMFMHANGYYAESLAAFGTDVIEEAEVAAQEIAKKYNGAVFFGGQLVFPEDTAMNGLLHNYTVFAVQKKLYQQGLPFVVLPIRV
ncbi:MAG: APC family permease [Candidatus Omnitrophica bacterium]|nr:APC family permease [Candidatus Omnitrophota bacterium]